MTLDTSLSSPNAATDPLALKTLSSAGTPPKARLASAKQAQDIFWQLKDASRPRLAKAAIIQGGIDGNPPFNGTKMRNAGQAWRANFNTLEFAGRRDAAKTPFYDLFSSAPTLAECDTDVASPQCDSATASRIRTQAFETLLKSWRAIHVQFETMLNDFIVFNKGFLWFELPDSWHFKRIPWHRVLFPDGTSVDPEEWEMFAIEHNWPVHKLWNFVKDADAAHAAGWNREQVLSAIRLAVPRQLASRYDDPLALQRALNESALYMSTMCSTVQAASVYVREFDGTWTRLLVQSEDGTKRDKSSAGRAMSPIEAASYQRGGDVTGSKLQDRDWLMFKQKVAVNVHEIMCPFVFEVGDGSINALEGFGKRLVSVMQLKDRMRNAQADNVLMATSLLLQAQNGAGQAKAASVQINGGVTVVPPGYALQPATMFGDVERTLAVNNDLDRMLDVNTGTYRPQFEKPAGNPESATAANIRFSQATVLTNSAVNRFYTQLDTFYDELYRRVTLDHSESRGRSDAGVKASLVFRNECRRQGLSDEQIKDRTPGVVRATRAIGNGSPVMRQQALASLGQLVPYMGPRGLLHWKIDFAAAWTGQRGSMRYFPIEDTAQRPTQDHWDATQENADLNGGNQVVFMDEQNHEIHAQVHLTAATGAIQSVLQGGADPAMPFSFLQLAMPHIGEHIAKVGRKNVRDELVKAYQQVSKEAQQVQQAAQQHMQQQGQKNTLSFDQQLALQKQQGDAQLDALKVENHAKLATTKEQHRQRINDLKTEHDLALSDARTAHEITSATAKTSTEIVLARQKAEVEAEVVRKKASQVTSKQ